MKDPVYHNHYNIKDGFQKQVESSVDLDGPRKSLGQAADENLGPFVVINIDADNANINGSVRDNKGLFLKCSCIILKNHFSLTKRFILAFIQIVQFSPIISDYHF